MTDDLWGMELISTTFQLTVWAVGVKYPLQAGALTSLSSHKVQG